MYYVILYCILLYYIKLYYIKLYYIKLYYIIVRHISGSHICIYLHISDISGNLYDEPHTYIYNYICIYHNGCIFQPQGLPMWLVTTRFNDVEDP